MKQAARNHNGNSRKLAGSLKGAWRKHKASLKEAPSKLETILWQGSRKLKESQRKFKVSAKEAEGKPEGNSKECLEQAQRKLEVKLDESLQEARKQKTA